MQCHAFLLANGKWPHRKSNRFQDFSAVNRWCQPFKRLSWPENLVWSKISVLRVHPVEIPCCPSSNRWFHWQKEVAYTILSFSQKIWISDSSNPKRTPNIAFLQMCYFVLNIYIIFYAQCGLFEKFIINWYVICAFVDSIRHHAEFVMCLGTNCTNTSMASHLHSKVQIGSLCIMNTREIFNQPMTQMDGCYLLLLRYTYVYVITYS